MDLPPIRIARNVKLIAHHDLGGAPNVGPGIGSVSAGCTISVTRVVPPGVPSLTQRLPFPKLPCAV